MSNRTLFAFAFGSILLATGSIALAHTGAIPAEWGMGVFGVSGILGGCAVAGAVAAARRASYVVALAGSVGMLPLLAVLASGLDLLWQPHELVVTTGTAISGLEPLEVEEQPAHAYERALELARSAPFYWEVMAVQPDTYSFEARAPSPIFRKYSRVLVRVTGAGSGARIDMKVSAGPEEPAILSGGKRIHIRRFFRALRAELGP